MKHHLPTLIAVLAAVSFSAVCALSAAADQRRRSPLSITIKLEKDTYREYEPVTGEVIVFNSRPATYPINFTVTVSRNGEFYRRSIVNTPVFSGRNTLDLDTFAKDIFNGPHAVADWGIAVSTGGDYPVSATAEFRIVAADYKEDPERRSKYMYRTSPEDPPSAPPKKRTFDFRTAPKDY